jgi:hypothetical protein
MTSMPLDMRSWSMASTVRGALSGTAASADRGRIRNAARTMLLASWRVTRKAYPYLAFWQFEAK